jgi:hypothetical protein
VKYILLALLAFITYQVVFKLVIPVYKTTRKIKKGFTEMHNRMEEQMRQRQDQHTKSATPPTDTKPKAGDYIDFEELK